MSEMHTNATPGVAEAVVSELPAKEALPADPGCLPAWDVDDFPEPQQKRTNWVKLLGPGMVLAGGSIGTGGWVVGPQAAARYHGAFLWAALASLLAPVGFKTEVVRYGVCGGGPFLGGVMCPRPGPELR